MVSEDDAFVYRGRINGAQDKIMAEVNRLATALGHERQRSARLIEALKSISPWQDGVLSIDDIVQLAIAEYEGRDE